MNVLARRQLDDLQAQVIAHAVAEKFCQRIADEGAAYDHAEAVRILRITIESTRRSYQRS